MSKTAVIGGGAAGMMAAVFAARGGNEVHLYEKTKNWGKSCLSPGRAAAI